MEVSTFELIYKPQTPVPPIGTGEVERVVQGYFLTITNLEDEPYQYGLEFVISPPPDTVANQASRSLAGNALVFVDTAGVNNSAGVLNGSLSSSRFRPSTGRINVPPQGTALIAVVPSVFDVPLDPTPLTQPNFEVRGYVRITLPTVVRVLRDPFRFTFEAQSEDPVRVLLTPQHRATFYTSAGTTSDQIQATLPVASGQALNTIEPQQPFVFPVPVPPLDEIDFATVVDDINLNPDMASPEMLAALLSQLDSDAVDLRGFNKALKAMDISLAVERRKR